MDDAPYGAYAVNLEQTIWYWNPSAERITGHKALDIIGRPCFQVIQNLAEYEDAPACQDGCPSLKATKEGRIPVSYDVWMLCASGQRKRVILTPLVIGATEVSGTVLGPPVPRLRQPCRGGAGGGNSGYRPGPTHRSSDTGIP